MNARMLVGGITAMLALAALPLRAQTVEAGVVIHSGPVTGHVEIGSPPPVVVYREPVRQIIVVEHIHAPHGNAHGWWKKHGYRPVTVYYDGDSYYARRFERRPGLREVVLYEREGRYYEWAEEWAERDDRHGHHRHGRGHHDDDDD